MPLAAPPQVLGVTTPDETADTSLIEFQPDPGEGAVYALLHEIYTPDGLIYEISLPQSGVRGVEVLGSGGEETIPDMLRFPVRRLVRGGNVSGASGEGTPEVLGIGDLITDVAERAVVKHVLHVIKAPVDSTLRQFIQRTEGEASVVPIEPDGTLGPPLESHDAWRARFDPAREHRVLLFVHGFASNVEKSLPRKWVAAFGPRYDAVLGYNHPTITPDPIQNAAKLLEMVPPDVQLRVDVVAHSRGGLVARSLVELQPNSPRLQVEHLLTCGAPHAGTLLADSDYWDRLISIGFTTASWLVKSSGVGLGAVFVPRLLELLLRAGSQFVLDLPGVEAMEPESLFLKQLNAPSDLAERVRYAAVVADFQPLALEHINYREALASLAAQVFMRTPNDLIVPTESMRSIDEPATVLPAGTVHTANNHHFFYFEPQEVQDFAEAFLFHT
jgi:pimeloyl-ACP methyl ester carboxylesterase